jgi:hypothetical protein
MMQIPSAQYLAGVMDSDGYITIYRHSRPDVHRGAGRSHGHDYRVQVGISWKKSQTTEALLRAIQTVYGGSVFVSVNHTGFVPRAENIVWTCGSRKAVKFLQDIDEYLVLKQEQALVCIEHGLDLGERNWGSRGRPAEEWAKLHARYERVHSLNHKGAKHTRFGQRKSG